MKVQARSLPKHFAKVESAHMHCSRHLIQIDWITVVAPDVGLGPVSTIAAMIQCNIRDGELASLILHGYSPLFTSAGVIALGCFVSLVRRVNDCT